MIKKIFILFFCFVSAITNLLSLGEKDAANYVPQEEFMYANSPLYTVTGEMPNSSTKIRPIEFSVFSGVLASYVIGQHIIQMETIWKEQTSFRFIEDGDYALYSDKVGHMYGAYLTSNVLRDGLISSGISLSTSKWLGGLMGLSYSTYIEIMDGYGKNWGFSPSDFYMDIAGSSFYLLQNYIQFFQNFTPKFMYIPPKWHGYRDRLPSDMFIDNYSSHTFFLSANVHNMLPDNLKKYWPKWLEISVGYAVRNLCSGDPNTTCAYAEKYNEFLSGDIKYVIALDYNFTVLAGRYGAPWDWLISQLKYFKLPSPAIEIGKYDTKFFLMYPFPLDF